MRFVRVLLFIAAASYTLAATTPLPSSAPSKTAVFEKRLALGTLDTLFFFDHFFTRRASVVSPNYLHRLAESGSPFHEQYVAYRNGKISKTELIDSLPHIAVLGDSLTKNLYVSPSLSLLWRARTTEQRNWFLDTDPSPTSVYSVYERLDKAVPVVASDYARGAAEVTAHPYDEILAKTLARTRNFTGQVDQMLIHKRFPDLVLIWIGHNNLNWVKGLSESERKNPAARLNERVQNFHENYAKQLKRLVERAQTENHKVAIVVFGLADCETFFRARNQAGAIHAQNARRYPYFDICAQRFESLKPPYQANMITLRSRLNRELRAVVAEFNEKLEAYPNIRLQYSDAFAQMDLSRVELLHPMDGQHLSAKGHKLAAEQAFAALRPSLSFLGIRNQAYVANQTAR